MADFPIKNWLSVGESGANDSNSVINKTNMNDLEKRIKETFDIAGLIEEIKTGENGYIKYKKGIFIQWMKKTYTLTMTQWTQDLALFYDSIGQVQWEVPFKTLYFAINESITNQYWFTHGASSATNASSGYIVSPSNKSNDCVIQYVGFGTWK